MKLNPMSPKIAAAILLAVTGATLSVTPAQAADEVAVPAHVIQTVNKYDLSAFTQPVFESPKVVSWAVAYNPNVETKTDLDPAQKALLDEDAQLAKKQKTITEQSAAVKRAEQERIAAEKAAAAKIVAEAAAAAEKAEAERLAIEKATAERLAAEKAQAEEAVAAAQRAVVAQAQATANAQGYSTPGAVTQSSSVSVAPNSSSAVAATPASSKIGAALVGSAYSQIGVKQDCTAMVEKALRSVGKNVGDLAPLDFYRYGTVVTNPQPGDLMISPGHVAIYVGNGMAISGGFDGHDTVLHPASYLAGSSFVRVS